MAILFDRDAPDETMYKSTCCCCIAMVGALITLLSLSFTRMLQAEQNLSVVAANLANFTDAWQQLDQIFAISADGQLGGYPSDTYYTAAVEGKWPGTIKGCDCTQAEAKYYTNQCGKFQGNCKQLPETGTRGFSKWYNSLPIYTVRMKQTSQSQLTSKIKLDGTCVSGYKKCGNPNSKSKGICVPENAIGCPITDISSTFQPGWTKTSFLGFSIYTKSEVNSNPIVDIAIRESHMCLNREHFPITPNRKPYSLFDVDYGRCIKNPTYSELFDMGELDLVSINSIPTDGLPQFQLSNDYRWKVLAGGFVEWAPECPVQMMEFASLTSNLSKTYSQYVTLFGLYIATFSAILLCYLGYFFGILNVLKESKPMSLYCCFVLRLLAWVISFPSMIIVTYRLVTFRDAYSKLVSAQCSSSMINSYLSTNYQGFDSNILNNTAMMLGLSVAGVVIESFCISIVYALVNE